MYYGRLVRWLVVMVVLETSMQYHHVEIFIAVFCMGHLLLSFTQTYRSSLWRCYLKLLYLEFSNELRSSPGQSISKSSTTTATTSTGLILLLVSASRTTIVPSEVFIKAHRHTRMYGRTSRDRESKQKRFFIPSSSGFFYGSIHLERWIGNPHLIWPDYARLVGLWKIARYWLWRIWSSDCAARSRRARWMKRPSQRLFIQIRLIIHMILKEIATIPPWFPNNQLATEKWGPSLAFWVLTSPTHCQEWAWFLGRGAAATFEAITNRT